MKNLPSRAALASLLLRAGWAPVTVLVLHEFLPKRTWRDQLDFCLHFSGGASIAFFLYHALGTFERVVGDLTCAGRYLFAYAAACTTGVFWEFGELLSDTFLHTRIQRSLRETMSDLVADATGAALALIMILLVNKRCASRR